MLQCHAVEIFHGEERLTLVLTDVVNRADIGMIQRRCGLRLAPEADQRLRVFGNLIRQKLESNETVQPGVLGLIYDTHASAPKFLDDAVVRDGLAKQLG
jgi:hypothetical protein